MKPLKLVMSAFGPYREVEVVDFEALEHRSLFLITGPTGAGKTTIFDAISFAIYGEASGAMRSPDSMRSHFATLDRLTEVTLEFKLRGIKYHIHRIPKQEKPKLKGEGTTEQKAEATLTIYNGTSPTVIVGVKNVNEKIERELGINAEQFKQIIMIPQGEFQKLLTAGSDDRQKILQQLFDTRIYQLLQQRLEQEAKLLENTIKNQRTIRANDLKRIEAVESSTLAELCSREDVPVETLIEAVEQQNASDIAQEGRLEADLSQNVKHIEAIISRREKAREENARIEQKTFVKNALDALELKKLSVQNLSSKLQRADEALSIRPLEEMMHLREQEYQQKYTDLSRLIERSTQIKEQLEGVQKQYNENHDPKNLALKDSLIQKLITLESYRKKIEKVESTTDELKHTNEMILQLASERTTLDKKLEASTSDLEALNKKLNESKDAQLDYVRCERVRDGIQDEIKLLKQLKKGIDSVASAKEAYESHLLKVSAYEDEVDGVRSHYLEVQRSVRSQQAASLAQLLNHLSPCPVCGSLEHPSPAQLSEGSYTQEAFESTEKAIALKETELAALKTRLAIFQERLSNAQQSHGEVLKEIQETLGNEWIALGEGDLIQVLQKRFVNLQELLSKTTSQLESYEHLFKTIESVHESIAKLSEGIQDIKSSLVALTQKDDQLKTIQIQRQTTLETLLAELPENYRSLDELERSIVQNQRDKDYLERKQNESKDALERINMSLIDVKARVNQIELDLKSAQINVEMSNLKFSQALTSSTFIDHQSYSEALMSRESMEEGRSIIEQFNKERHTLQAQLQELERLTIGKEFVNLDAFTQKIDYFTRESERITTEIGSTRQRRLTNEKLLLSIKKITQAIKDQEKDYNKLGHLAKIAKGDNKPRITFERYVLAAFLEDIIKAANTRLSQMSGGRYYLGRTEELERSNAKGGLELEVFDHYTGRARHVKTLSGGESFKASLAMALGLSDVVQAYAGGVQLDTMFIDEGFGTLDQESLDSAINCLVDLQKSGRLVGIISHVQELKERIDTRLEVYSSATGSRTAFVL